MVDQANRIVTGSDGASVLSDSRGSTSCRDKCSSVIGTRSAQLYDLTTVLRDSNPSLVRSLGLSWNAWLIHLETEMLVRDLSVLSSAEGLIGPAGKQASIARFLRALSGLSIKVRLQDLSDLV
jgi:hypothetical protein